MHYWHEIVGYHDFEYLINDNWQINLFDVCKWILTD